MSPTVERSSTLVRTCWVCSDRAPSYITRVLERYGADDDVQTDVFDLEVESSVMQNRPKRILILSLRLIRLRRRIAYHVLPPESVGAGDNETTYTRAWTCGDCSTGCRLRSGKGDADQDATSSDFIPDRCSPHGQKSSHDLEYDCRSGLDGFGDVHKRGTCTR